MSRFMWLVLLPNKDHTTTAIKISGRPWKSRPVRNSRLCAPIGVEFTSVEFGRYYAERGVRRQLTAL
jgi:hypothetical protein